MLFVHEWHGRTTVHPAGLAVLLAMVAAILVVPRRYAVWPIILIACFVAPAQRLVLFSADFDFLRLMTLAGWLRLLIRAETRPLRSHCLDAAVVAWALAHVATGLLGAGPDVLMNNLGFAFDVIGMYFLFRVLIHDWEDIRQIVHGFMLVSIPVALAFALELSTGRNMFAVLGGVPDITMVRDGRMRCQGAYAHPILAGLFWASVLPLIAAHVFEGRGRRHLAILGMGASGFIIIASASASPISAVMFAVAGTAIFGLRHSMRLVRWSILGTLVVLHLIMLAPVWHLVSRINLVGGSSGYHRFMLIDRGIANAHEWWLIGSNRGTAHWGYGMEDVTNTYLVQGLHGGVWLLGLFIIVISLAFREVGRTWRHYHEEEAAIRWSWMLGVALLVHTTSFLAITYFGQMSMTWYLLLAMIGSMAPRPLAQAAPVGARRAVLLVPTVAATSRVTG